GMFSGHGIASVGTVIAAAMQAIFIFFTALTTRSRLGEYLQYAAFNLVFNLLLFHSLAPFVVKLLGAGPVY
ncbi:MAG: hypothetical protein ABEJ66_00565, partial [Candidatus Nanohaloarchaea archaeon]